MAGGAEADALGGETGVGVELVEGGDEAGDVDEVLGERELAGGVGGGAHAVMDLGGVGRFARTLYGMRGGERRGGVGRVREVQGRKAKAERQGREARQKGKAEKRRQRGKAERQGREARQKGKAERRRHRGESG